MKLTREEAYELHQQLWYWLSENPAVDKYDWPKWNELEEYRPEDYDYCFGCMLAYNDCDTNGCFIKWPGDSCVNTVFGDKDGIYLQWLRAEDFNSRSQLAKQIAELPMREEDE